MKAYQAAQYLNDACRPDTAGHINRQAFSRVLIDHRQAFQCLTIGAGVIHEIVAPDTVFAGGQTRPGVRGRYPAPLAFGRHLKTRLAPQARTALLTDMESFAT